MSKQEAIKNKNECSCPWSKSSWNLFFKIGALIVAILAIVAVIIGTSIAGNPNTILRFGIRATPDQVYPPGNGEAGGLLDGLLTFDYAENSVSYDFSFYNISIIESLIIRGPRAAGQRQGSILFSLCGLPNTVDVCDPFSVPGQISKSGLKQLYPGPLDAKPVITQIRENPTRYYLEVLTSNYPVEPGALRADFIGIIGTP